MNRGRSETRSGNRFGVLWEGGFSKPPLEIGVSRAFGVHA